MIRLRQQVANALADIDQPQCVPLVTAILGDKEPSVRMAAAYALARMSQTGAATGLAVAIGTDFGTINNRSRNGVMHAHVVRAAAGRFAGEEATLKVLEAGVSSAYPSVRFLSICATPGEEIAGNEPTEALELR